MYIKVEVFIPEQYEKNLIDALNTQGLLGAGAYDYVYASTKVMGHWRPLAGSKPFIGQTGALCGSKEIKLEFRIQKNQKNVAESIIRRNHPYEEPIINFIELI